jgi:hypothetical protein
MIGISPITWFLISFEALHDWHDPGRQRVLHSTARKCERSVGTVFQLPNPDAIYSRDKEKERKVGRHPMFVFAHGPRAAEAR